MFWTTLTALLSVVFWTETRTTGWPFTRANVLETGTSLTQATWLTVIPLAGSTSIEEILAMSFGWFLVDRVIDCRLLLMVPIDWLIAEPAMAAVTCCGLSP